MNTFLEYTAIELRWDSFY